jgi:hypothetical protein
MNAAEAERRASRTDLIEELFRRRPLEWIGVDELMTVGGLCAWRTRVADARRRFARAGDGGIEWNGDVHRSAYRYVPALPATMTHQSPPDQATLFCG